MESLTLQLLPTRAVRELHLLFGINFDFVGLLKFRREQDVEDFLAERAGVYARRLEFTFHTGAFEHLSGRIYIQETSQLFFYLGELPELNKWIYQRRDGVWLWVTPKIPKTQPRG